MKRVLYITPGCFDKGGVSRYNRYQIQAIKAIYGENSITVVSKLSNDENSFEDDIVVAWSGDNTKTFFNNLRFIFYILYYTIKIRPDVILAAHINYAFLIQLLKIISPKSKTILNVYGLEVWSDVTWLKTKGLESADYIISDCHFTANYVSDNYRVNVSNIHIVWDCVDLSKFNTSAEIDSEYICSEYNIPNPNDNYNIMTLGRLDKDTARHKGYERLLMVFSEVIKNIPNAKLIFGGTGNLKEILLQKSEILGISDSVKFTGRIAEEDLPAVYRMSHVFSLVSERGYRLGEGLPLTPLEAMACGAPIIVGTDDGSQEAIVNNSNGYAIDPHDLEKHKSIIIEWYFNPEIRKEKAENAKIIVKQEFSFDTFFEKHNQILSIIFK